VASAAARAAVTPRRPDAISSRGLWGTRVDANEIVYWL
jgi:hypothetical protein